MAARYAAVTFAEHTKPRYVNTSLNLVALDLCTSGLQYDRGQVY